MLMRLESQNKPIYLQAIENVFAIANKVPMGSCLCQPPGGYPNNTIERMEEFLQFDRETCRVSSTINSCALR